MRQSFISCAMQGILDLKNLSRRDKKWQEYLKSSTRKTIQREITYDDNEPSRNRTEEIWKSWPVSVVSELIEFQKQTKWLMKLAS